VLDWEVTTKNKGSSSDIQNKPVCLGYKYGNNPEHCSFLPDEWASLDMGLLIVGFNLKFDLLWSRRLGHKMPRQIWDVQLAEFILSGQTIRYPSLEGVSQSYGLGTKDHTIEHEYWNKGIDTDVIPPDVLSRYCKRDIELTYQVYLRQKERFAENPKLLRLFKLQCEDLLVLLEMEANGQIYDEQLCNQRSKEIETELEEIRVSLASLYPDIPINFGSGDQLSAWLYGGSIPYEVTEHVGFYKNGKPKYKKVEKEYVLPRLVEPIKGSTLKKPGFFKTDEGTLRKLKGSNAKKFVAPLLRLAELDKLNSTYYKGLPEKAREMNWPPGKVHGQFNQCVAQTGRLSSSQPNLQNFASNCLDIFISRYADE
jgi:DNA polymerase I-like protein with 3'-5' exonuclease and polymerase domains